jgi:hypothetical protein
LRDHIQLNQAVTVAIQLRTLRTLIDHVHAALGRGVRPVVEIDLDLTAVMPEYRTRLALVEVGKAVGIDLFENSDHLPLLPGYSDEAWVAFVQSLDLPTKCPKVQWLIDGKPNTASGEPFNVFHKAYWTLDRLVEDLPTPGLGAFVHRLNQCGAEVVFISGRWLGEHVQPSLAVLQRAGIRDPKLVIGNERHPSRVPPELALSDAAIKAAHQVTVAKLYGTPVAIIDDRDSNRDAVISAVGPDVMGIAACIPGFTCDPVNAKTPLRLSTFESFDRVMGDAPVRVYMDGRYHRLGIGQPWHGLYEGLGLNRQPYVLPRLASPANRPTGSAPFAEILQRFACGSLGEPEFVKLCSATIPPLVLDRIEWTISEAKALAHRGLAAPFPESEEDIKFLRLSLATSWLHSRDIETVMASLGYSLPATGVHDVEEYAPAQDIRATIAAKVTAGSRYSDWMPRWIATLDDEQSVNVGSLNPALSVGMSSWTPHDECEDAMDVHRLSSHHNGDGQERYDPVEAAVNNILHQREGRFGIRKEEVQGWDKIFAAIARETDAERLAKSSAGRQIVRDAVVSAAALEIAGYLTPWGLVTGAGFSTQPWADQVQDAV